MVYITVRLPHSLSTNVFLIDLRLESREQPLSDKADLLERHFVCLATRTDLIHERLSPDLIKVLAELSRSYPVVLMTHEHIRYGALDLDPPADSARHLAQLVAALSADSASVKESGIGFQHANAPHQDFVTVSSTTDPHDAELCRSFLEAAGIPVLLDAYDEPQLGSNSVPLRTIEIRVPSTLANDAATLLAQQGSSTDASAPSFCHFCGAEVSTATSHCGTCGRNLLD